MTQHDLFPALPKSAAEGAQDAEAGMARAMANANEEPPDWSEQARAFLLAWLSRHNEPFMAHEVTLAAESEIPSPPTRKAWGAILLRAAKDGLIRKVGFGVDPNRHNSPSVLWERVR